MAEPPEKVIILECPGCNVRYRVRRPVEGKVYRCLKCKQPLTEPEAAPADAALDHAADKTEGAKEPSAPKRIEHYRIYEVLGRGGMATVYRAEHTALGRMCALKVLAPELAARDRVYVDRFVREARAAAGLNHPHIVQVFNVGQAAGAYYIEMEYVPGSSLQKVMTRERCLPFLRATEIAIAVAKALEAAQAKHLAHRDIKPDNILLGENGEVKVTDFGLAKTVEAATHLTQTGSVMGTPYFMSPEQCEGEAADGRSDIYALGATYYYMLTGRLPYTGKSALAIMYKHKHDPIPSACRLKPELPESVDKVIAKAMAKDPNDRYQTATEMREALEALADFDLDMPTPKDGSPALTDECFPSGEPAEAEPRPLWLQNKPLYNAAAAAAGVLVGLALLWLAHRRPPAAPEVPPEAPGDLSEAEHAPPPKSAARPSGKEAKTAKTTKKRRPRALPTRLIVGGKPRRPRRATVVRQDGRGRCRTLTEALLTDTSGLILIQDSGRYADALPGRGAFLRRRGVRIAAAAGAAPTIALAASSPPLRLGAGWAVRGVRFECAADRRAPAVVAAGEAVVGACLFSGGQRGVAWTSARLTVSNCVFLNSDRGAALEVRDMPKSEGLRRLQVVHCTFYGWREAIVTPCSETQSVSVALTDNIFSHIRLLVHENANKLAIWPPFQWNAHHNLYWRIDGFYRLDAPTLVEAKTFADWRKTKADEANSLAVDPDFVDPAAGDLRLKPSSPAKGRASDGRDRGAILPSASWRRWAARPAPVVKKTAPQASEAEQRLALGKMSIEFARLLRERRYEELAARCAAALKRHANDSAAAAIREWGRMAQIGRHIVTQAEKRIGEWAAQKKQVVFSVRGAGGGAMRLPAPTPILSVENGVIRYRLGKTTKETPVAQLGADTLLTLTRPKEPPSADRRILEAAFLFGDGQAHDAEKTLDALDPKTLSPAQKRRVDELRAFWANVAASQQRIEHEQEAARLVEKLRAGLRAGQTEGLLDIADKLKTDYADTAAYAKAKDLAAAARLAAAGDAILAKARPRTAKLFAPSEIKRSVARKSARRTDLAIVVKKDGQVRSISAALLKAKAAKGRVQIIIADSATYAESLLLTRPGVTIAAQEGRRPVIAPASRVFAVRAIDMKDIALVGLTFRCGLRFTRCEDMLLYRCRVEGAPRAGLALIQCADALIAECEFVNAGGAGVEISACSDAVLFRNQSVANAGPGFDCSGPCVLTENLAAYNGAGAALRAPGRKRVGRGAYWAVGNVLWRNWGPGVASTTWPPGMWFRDNLIAFNRGAGLALRAPSEASAITHNTWCDNAGAQLAAAAPFAASAALLVRDNVLLGPLAADAWPARGSTQPAYVVDRNLLFAPAPPAWSDRVWPQSLEQWRKLTGQDINSRWARPEFAKPERYEFQLAREPDAAAPPAGVLAAGKRMAMFRGVMEDPALAQKGLEALAAARRGRFVASKQTLLVGSGSKAQYKTIAAALDAAAPGSVIRLAPGRRFVESVVIDRSRVALVSSGPRPAVVAAPKGAAFAVSVQAPGAAVIGLRILAGETGVMVSDKAAGALVADNVVRGAGEAGILVSGANDVIVQGNACLACKEGIVVERADAAALLVNHCAGARGAGVTAQEVTAFAAAGNVVRSNGGPGFAVESAWGISVWNTLAYANKGDGMRCRDAAYVFIEHNTLYGNEGAGLRVERLKEWTRIAGNLAAANAVGIAAREADQAAPLILSWNGAGGNRDGYGKWNGRLAVDLAAWQKATGRARNSTAAPAGFAARKEGDFRLRKGSACAKRAPDGRELGVRWSESAWLRHLAAVKTLK